MSLDNNLPKGWMETTLGDLIHIYNQQRIPLSTKVRNTRKGIYPYYGASNIVDYIDDYIFDGEYLLISEDGENLNTRNTPIAFIANGKFWVNNHAHIVKGKSPHLTKYFELYFTKLNISAFVTGAVQPKLSKGNLVTIPITIPKKIEEQKAIAAILTSFDDKIELLQAQNKTLETIAQTIFKEWFGKYQIGDDLPEGWRVGKFGEIVKPQKGKNITKKQVINGIYPVIAGGLKPSVFHNMCNTKSPVITISASGANAGFVCLHNNPVWSSDSSFIDLSITNNIYFCYVYLKINQSNLYDKQEGSAIPHIYPRHLEYMDMIIPTNKEMIKYEIIVNHFFEKVGTNLLQIQTLKQTRDALLPKLMSGKLRVNDFKEN
jgi:type I restriction enzyme, S subunit